MDREIANNFSRNLGGVLSTYIHQDLANSWVIVITVSVFTTP